jgi:peptide/nickel transport system substrate-binding protein
MFHADEHIPLQQRSSQLHTHHEGDRLMKIVIRFTTLALLCASVIVSPALAAPRALSTQAPSNDTLVEVTMGQPETLDPALDYETSGLEVIQQVYETLLIFKRDLQDEVVPQLATGWTISQDGKTYTFTIRQGVRFHNGDSLTPADVAFSFQRGLLQGGSGSPQWLLFQPLLGTYPNLDVSSLVDPSGGLIDNRDALKAADPTQLVAACQQVKNAITYDDNARTVTFHLQQAWSPFLVTLTGTWGSILDRAWVKAHGGWNGSCDTWQNYYATSVDESRTTAIGSGENGTGAFMLSDWSADEIALSRNPNYWRTTPAWTGGPSGTAALTWVKIENVPDGATRASMLLSGEADLGSFYSTDYPGLSSSLMMRYVQGHPDPILVNPSGVLKRYENVESAISMDGLFNYDIKTNASINLIGSGVLDEDGIPANFFSDIHVRKAFNEAFDWDTFIQEAYGGDALQRRGPIRAGLPGYLDTQPTYTHDAAQAMSEMTLAWGGALVSRGFTVTIGYNTGNDARQKFAEILKDNIEGLSPKFHVNIVSQSWSDFQTYFKNGYIPLSVNGWQEDIADPYNWVFTYMAQGGIYPSRQSMPSGLLNQFSPKVAECVQKLGADAAQCYAELQGMAYDQAIDMFLAQGLLQNYIRTEVQGYYISPAINNSPYFYALSKSTTPVTEQVTQDTLKTVNVTEPSGVSDTIAIPAGSFTQNASLVVSPGGIAAGQTTGFRLGEQGFDISAFKEDGSQLHPTFDSSKPVSITVHYNPAGLDGIVEETLKLYYLNPVSGAWEDAACGASQLDKVNQTLTVPVCHFSRFALGGVGYSLYLPFSKR